MVYQEMPSSLIKNDFEARVRAGEHAVNCSGHSVRKFSTPAVVLGCPFGKAPGLPLQHASPSSYVCLQAHPLLKALLSGFHGAPPLSKGLLIAPLHSLYSRIVAISAWPAQGKLVGSVIRSACQ